MFVNCDDGNDDVEELFGRLFVYPILTGLLEKSPYVSFVLKDSIKYFI